MIARVGAKVYENSYQENAIHWLLSRWSGHIVKMTYPESFDEKNTQENGAISDFLTISKSILSFCPGHILDTGKTQNRQPSVKE